MDENIMTRVHLSSLMIDPISKHHCRKGHEPRITVLHLIVQTIFYIKQLSAVAKLSIANTLRMDLGQNKAEIYEIRFIKCLCFYIFFLVFFIFFITFNKHVLEKFLYQIILGCPESSCRKRFKFNK